MKKTIKYLTLLLVFVFGLTGCVKYNSTMTINKDKSMDYTIIYAVDTSVFGDKSILTDNVKKSLESEGFKISDYNENSMKGFTISKKFKNIDDISSNREVEYDLSGLMSGKSASGNVFKVKKGFLKNTYIATFKFDSSESDLNSSDSDSTDASDKLDSTTDGDELETENSLNSNNTLDSTDSLDSLSSASSSMDLSFNVILPYKAKSSNATKKENGNKKLTWEFTNDKIEKVEFTFELYNNTNLYILIGIGGVFFVALIGGIVVIAKKKKKPAMSSNLTDTPVNSNDNQEPITQQPLESETTSSETVSQDQLNDFLSAPQAENAAETNNLETNAENEVKVEEPSVDTSDSVENNVAENTPDVVIEEPKVENNVGEETKPEVNNEPTVDFFGQPSETPQAETTENIDNSSEQVPDSEPVDSEKTDNNLQ